MAEIATHHSRWMDSEAKLYFNEEGFDIEFRKRSFDEQELLDAIPDVHVLGIRSKTHVSQKAIAKAKRLLTIGAFCIGTNHVDFLSAKSRGIPVSGPTPDPRSGACLAACRAASARSRQYAVP